MKESKPTGDEAIVHVYDGIEEQDHPIPLWFSLLFYGTILFGGVYYYWYELGEGRSIQAEYAAHSVRDELREREARNNGPGVTESELRALLDQPPQLAGGKSVFVSKCASCHGNQAEGGIGPNLTDDYWLHGAQATDIHRTIADGVLDKGMPPWGSVLSAEEIHQVTAYVLSVRGTRPPNAKAPQGDLVKE